MLKMYAAQSHAGSTPEHWEENWERSEYARAVSFCAVDPLRPLFEKYLRPDSVMLEGGCGIGNYVTYYAAKGYRVVGVDFAQRALKTLRGRQPDAMLSGGDVSVLPFADETFDLYYSGGVVEHFEDGATASLAEARRVLKDDGVLLISVPYFSPLRRVLSVLNRDEWRVVSGPETDKQQVFEDKKFFQYAYKTGEFEAMLANAGLKTIETQGYAVLWGLYELPFFGGQSEHNHGGPQKAVAAEPTADIGELVKDRPASLAKRLIVNEDASVPVLGLGVKAMRWAAANMMMYVCVRN
ncbi:MAG: class I SAM-dependent methyltransferase [Pyrinomonadaceae bacterium]